MRYRDWDLRLLEYATSVRGLPFEWGQTNCAALVAGSVDAMTGSALYNLQGELGLDEPLARELSAQRFTRSTLLDAGLIKIAGINYAQRGDVVLAYSEEWECSHVCLGKYVLTSSPDRGVFFGRMAGLMAMAEDVEVFRCL